MSSLLQSNLHPASTPWLTPLQSCPALSLWDMHSSHPVSAQVLHRWVHWAHKNLPHHSHMRSNWIAEKQALHPAVFVSSLGICMHSCRCTVSRLWGLVKCMPAGSVSSERLPILVNWSSMSHSLHCMHRSPLMQNLQNNSSHSSQMNISQCSRLHLMQAREAVRSVACIFVEKLHPQRGPPQV